MSNNLIIYVENGKQARGMIGYLHSKGIEPSIEHGFYEDLEFFPDEYGDHLKLRTLELTVKQFSDIIKNLPKKIGVEVE